MTGTGSNPGVLCVGRLYCDLVFTGLPSLPAMGREIYAEGLSLHPGGGAAITAAHLAALGRPAHLAATLPAAPFGALVADRIDAAGIDRSLCAVAAPGGDPQITVALVRDGDRAFVTRRTGRALPDLDATRLAGRALGHMHIGELATLVERPGLIGLARACGLSLSLDCSWDDSVRAECAALIAQVDVFLPNAEEVAQLHALGLAAPFAPLTVIKRGAQGAEARLSSGETFYASVQPVKVRDTTGAGDAFNSGFLHGWLRGDPVAACLALGNACGARTVQTIGGFGPGRRATSA